MTTIILNDKQAIETEDDAIEITNNVVVCVETKTGEGMIIPLTSIYYILEGNTHDE